MPPEQEIAQLEALIDQIIEMLEQTIASGEQLSDEFQGEIANELQETTQRIAQLQQQTQQPPQPPQPPEQPPEQPPGVNGPPPSSTAQLLWILAGQQEDYFLQYLQNYPDSSTRSLLNNPGELERTIQYLHRMMPSGTQPQMDGIQHADLNSSNIYGFRYDPNTKKLLVRFQGGSVYGYDGVPPQVYKMFSSGAVPAKTNGQNQYGRWWEGKNPSLGASFYSLIRQGGYPYQRVQ